ncbi:hypothetical protein CKO51_12380 [Rhodopirellula sp. SM50]|nr:hypothetical protein CKO51_12380 [Rhodopirellula sp. SM50]
MRLVLQRISLQTKHAEVLDPARFDVEILHLGETTDQPPEAEPAGVKSVPALVINGQPFHLNHGAVVCCRNISLSTQK